MIKMICDRCGKEITGTSYYTVRIYAEDINPTVSYEVTASTALQNVSTNMMALYNSIPQYCKECRDKIEAFINKKE